jgi:hypothetical protein
MGEYVLIGQARFLAEMVSKKWGGVVGISSLSLNVALVFDLTWVPANTSPLSLILV